MADLLADFPSDTSKPVQDLGTIGIGQGVGANGIIDSPSDFDFFKVQLTAGVTYRITVSGNTLDDPALGFQTLDGNIFITDNDSGIGKNPYLAFTPDTTGTYYIGIRSEVVTGAGTFQVEVLGLDLFAGAAEASFAFMTQGSELPPASISILEQFAQGQFAYGAQIGVFSPTVYMYEALGLALAEITPALHSGLLENVADEVFVSIIYEVVFGIQPGAAQVQGFQSQLDFFESIYVASGAFGSDLTHIQTLARGAVIGQMLGLNAEIAISNASTATANLIDDSSIPIVGDSGMTTSDFMLL